MLKTLLGMEKLFHESTGIGYAYAPNKWRLTLFGDPRNVALRVALQRSLEKLPTA